MYGTVLGGFLRGLGFPLGVTLSGYESYDDDKDSFALPYKNIFESSTG